MKHKTDKKLDSLTYSTLPSKPIMLEPDEVVEYNGKKITTPPLIVYES